MGQICHSHCCVTLWFCLSYKSRCVFVQFSSLYSQSKNKSCVQANTHARLSHSLSIADSSSVVPLAAGAAAGSVLLLILLCVLALVAVVALKRRMHAQTVESAEEELHNVTIKDIVLPTSNALRPHSVDEEEDQLQYVMDCSALQHNYAKVNTSSLQPQSIYDDIVLPE